MNAIVFDLGGTYLRCAYYIGGGALREQCKMKIVSFLDVNEIGLIWENIVSAIVAYTDSLRDASLSDPIIVAFPGPISKDGRVLGAPTIIGSSSEIPNLQKILVGRTRRRVILVNDISAATWRFSQIVSVDRFLVVTVSSGIGGKIFDRHNELGVIDDVPYAGEIGHSIVDFSPDAPLCDCGGRGHLGAISSGRGIERLGRRRAQQDIEGFLKSACVTKYGATIDTLSNTSHIVPAFLDGDLWTEEIIFGGTLPLARQIVATTLAVGLERVIIIGGFALAAGEKYIKVVRQAAVQYCDYPLLAGRISETIVLGSPGEEACLLGAAVYGVRRLA